MDQIQRLCNEAGDTVVCLPDGTIGPSEGSWLQLLALGSSGTNLLLETPDGEFRFDGMEPAPILAFTCRDAGGGLIHLHHAGSGAILRCGDDRGSDRFRLSPVMQPAPAGLLAKLPASFTVNGDGLRWLFTHGDEALVPVAQAVVTLLEAAEVRSLWAAVTGVQKGVFLDVVRDHSRERIQYFRSFTRDIFRREIELWGWSIGEKTYGAPMILEPSLGKLTIGRYCSMANPTIILGNHDVGTATTYPFMSLWIEWPGTTVAVGIDDHVGRNVTIGNDVWIGHQAIILPGATIGDGAVIGAGSVVGGTVPPYAICVGNPGKVRRYRFDEKTIARLQRLQWWNWPDAAVDRHLPKILGRDVSAFLDEAEQEFMPPGR